MILKVLRHCVRFLNTLLKITDFENCQVSQKISEKIDIMSFSARHNKQKEMIRHKFVVQGQ
jgi:hypothetical protein